jgi:cytochrome c
MKRSLMLCGVLSVLASSSAFAQADLAKAKNCMACHAVANKVVGPAYKDVAAKYAGQKGAEDKLVAKVMKGGSGSWGSVPMPANPQVSEAEARSLVKWVLSAKYPVKKKKKRAGVSQARFFIW